MITVEEWNCTYVHILVYIGEYAIDKSTEFSGFETIKELCEDLYFHIPYMKNSGTLCPEILITLLVQFHGFRFIPKPKKDDGFDFVINLHWDNPKEEENGFFIREQNQERRRLGKQHWVRRCYRKVDKDEFSNWFCDFEGD